MPLSIEQLKERVIQNNILSNMSTPPALLFPSGIDTNVIGSTVIYTGNLSSLRGISSSIPSKPEAFPSFPNPHPWLNDLRSMIKMLSGELEIPHYRKPSGNAQQRRKFRRRAERNSFLKHLYLCEVCAEAAVLKAKFQKQQA